MNRPAPTVHPAKTFASLCGGFVLTGIVNTLLGPLIPWLTARWELSDVAAGSLFTIQFAGGLIGGAVSGAMASRIGVGRTLAAGHASMAAGLVLVGAGNHAVGAIGMLIAGLGLGFVIPTTNLMSARLAPHRAASALGAVNLCWGIGAAVWPLMLAAFTLRGMVPAALLTVSALLVVMAAAVVRASFPHDDVEVRQAEGSHMPAVVRLAIFGACIALYSGSEAAFGGWITEYARRIAGGTDATSWELSASAFWGGVTAGRGLVAISLARRLERRAMFAGLSVVFVCIAVVLLVPHPSLMLVMSALCGLGFSPVFPVTVAALAHEFPARFAGPMVALGSAGAALLPWLVGVVSDRTGSLTIGMTTLLASVLMLIVLQIVRVARPRGGA
jgi:fucose permease